MSNPDVRWIQRFENYGRAIARLTDAVELSGRRPLTEREQQGLIQAFEFTHELGWSVLKDYLEGQGFSGIIGSKGATREAFKNGFDRRWRGVDGQDQGAQPDVAYLSKGGGGRHRAGYFRALSHPALVAMARQFAEREREREREREEA